MQGNHSAGQESWSLPAGDGSLQLGQERLRNVILLISYNLGVHDPT